MRLPCYIRPSCLNSVGKFGNIIVFHTKEIGPDKEII